MPRILIVSHNCFSTNLNNGKTLEALFSEFGKDSLAQLYFHSGHQPDYNYCRLYWNISEMDIVRNLFGRKQVGHRIVQNNIESAGTIPGIQKYPVLFRKIKSRTGDFFRDLLWKIGRWESAELYKWIADFDPQLIFVLAGGAAFSINVALKLSKKLSIPLVAYLTDDYLFSIEKNSLVERVRFHNREHRLKKLISASQAHYVIGEYMAREYGAYFSTEFIPVMNCVKITPYENYPLRDNLEIVYFGGLHLNRWRMIVRLAQLLPSNALIKVYTSTSSIDKTIRDSFSKNGIMFCGTLSGADLNTAMRNADVLLHVESDDPRMRRFTRLAVSTKIPEYLITGRPILGFGPTEVASMKILTDNGIGYVLDIDNGSETLKDTLGQFLNNYEMRLRIGEAGYKFAIENFDRVKISKKLMSQMEKIVCESK